MDKDTELKLNELLKKADLKKITKPRSKELADLYNEIAEIYFNDKMFEKAINYLEKSLVIDENNAKTNYDLAFLLGNDNQYVTARKYYEKALQINPIYSDAHNNLAILLANGYFKEYEKAKEHCIKAINIAPQSPNAHGIMAYILEKFFDSKNEAKYYYSKAKELSKEEKLTKTIQKLLSQIAFDEPAFISQIKVNQIFHLKDLEPIAIDENEPKHLLITGKNGSGKTILLKAIKNYLNTVITTDFDKVNAEGFEKTIDAQNPELITIKPDIKDVRHKYDSGDFIIVSFDARRELKSYPVEKVEKYTLEINRNISGELYAKLVTYMVDLEFKGSRAYKNKDENTVAQVEKWFEFFTNLLKDLYQDSELKLEFDDSSNYNFKIKTQGKEFDFTQLADGYSSVLNIVVELIMRMSVRSEVGNYNIEGIVLIDEPEAHLHVEMQKKFLPLITKLFPNVQIIAATHSPFILSSLENAVVYDLEKRIRVTDLSAYSYDSIVETYFGVDQYSQKALEMINEYEKLVNKYLIDKKLPDDEFSKMIQLRNTLEKLPNSVSKELQLKFNMIEINRLSHD